MTQGLPECTALRLDPGTRRSDAGRTLIGGSPLRLLRLRDAGARIVDDLAAGAPVGNDPTRMAVARRLLDAGLAHPVPCDPPPLTTSIVVPFGRDPNGLTRLLDDLEGLGLPTIVVDDGSAEPRAVADAVAGRGIVLRHDRNLGPAAARNTGWRAATTDLVAFVDADVTPAPGWLSPLLAHFADPAVSVVAPRVRGAGGPPALACYEEHHSPLDLGPLPARVVPGGRVGYVPTATVVFRREVLSSMGGFDEGMRSGEDVDLVWRTIAAGHTVRYEPSAEVHHANRATWSELAAQRRLYGSAAAALHRRHPGAVAPVAANVWTMVAWGLVAIGGRRGAAVGGAVGAGSLAPLVRLLRDRTDRPVAEALRLGGLGHLAAGRWLAAATVRTWLPIAGTGALGSRRVRRGLLAAAVVPNLLDWIDRRPAVDPVRWVGMRLVDDAAYCAGVWEGCIAERSFGSLAPRATGIDGVI